MEPLTGSKSRIAVSLANLEDVAAIYGGQAAEAALSVLAWRIGSLLGSGINVACDRPGALLILSGVYEAALDESAADLWAAIADAVGQPIHVNGVSIVLAATPVKEDLEAPFTAGVRSAKEAESYRADMARAALAFDALISGQAEFAEQAIASTADTGPELYRERLIRVRDDAGELIPAGELVQSIERLRLTRAFDYLVVQATLVELAARPEAVLGCNISSLSALHDDWWHQMLGELAERPDIAGRLIIEMTETAELPDVDGACRFISALRACGCRVAIDDFGAGTSSIAFVSRSSADIIKLDGSFIRNCDRKPGGEALLERLLSLVSHFAQTIIVEGVETEKELDRARSIGAQWVQGFHIDVPAERAMQPGQEAASSGDLFAGAGIQ